MTEHREDETELVDLNDSPFEVGAVEGLPFGKNSEEMRAIERVLAWDPPVTAPRKHRWFTWVPRRVRS